jgi:hypothetical protein
MQQDALNIILNIYGFFFFLQMTDENIKRNVSILTV